MATLVHNPRQIIAESLPAGQVGSAQIREGRQAIYCISSGGPEVAAVRLVHHNRFLVSVNIYLSSQYNQQLFVWQNFRV
jgi:hypothetical protein